MNLAQALKVKNRLAGDLARNRQILQRENARRSDSVSKVNREEVFALCEKLSQELGELKGRITVANVGIYPRLERMAELKSQIAWLQMLPMREGEELVLMHGDQAPLRYTWNSFINQEDADQQVVKLQRNIEALQDEVDAYNAVTQI